MNIVLLETENLNATPFTTSKIIADGINTSHKSVKNLIQKHFQRLERFGQIPFKKDAVVYSRGSNIEIVYHLNQEQATFLFTLFRNSEIVLNFKEALVKAFYAMLKELNSRKLTRHIGTAITKSLNDMINDCYTDSPNKHHYYSLYSNLVYKKVLGMNAKKYQEKYEIPDGHLQDYLTEKELKDLEKIRNFVKALLPINNEYEFIKMQISNIVL